MFEFLSELFKSDSLMQQAFESTSEMLHEDYIMFRESIRSLRHSNNADLEFDIYAADKKINEYEREVRRKVLAHLAIVQSKDVARGLVLISVVGDVERIGDYTKNIYELAVAHPACLNGSKFEEKLIEVEEIIMTKFKGVNEAYATSDEEMATKLMVQHKDISKWCDDVVNELIKSPPDDLMVGHAVTLSLYVRHMKRISAHLTNIVSSVVNPFPQIGYRPKEWPKS